MALLRIPKILNSVRRLSETLLPLFFLLFPDADYSNNPTLGLSVDLGTIKELSQAVVWAIGVVRDPSIRTISYGGIESRSTYFWTRYQNISDAVS